MPFALIIIGTVLLISSVRNTYGQTTPAGGKGLGALLTGDFTGQSNFIYWLIALLIIGAIGYIKVLRPISVAFLVLLIIVIFLKQGNPTTGTGGGFFQQFTSAIGVTQTAQQAATQSTGSLLGLAGLGSIVPLPGSATTF